MVRTPCVRQEARRPRRRDWVFTRGGTLRGPWTDLPGRIRLRMGRRLGFCVCILVSYVRIGYAKRFASSRPYQTAASSLSGGSVTEDPRFDLRLKEVRESYIRQLAGGIWNVSSFTPLQTLFARGLHTLSGPFPVRDAMYF